MLYDVEGILAKPAFFTEIDSKRAVADNWFSGVPKQLTSKP